MVVFNNTFIRFGSNNLSLVIKIAFSPFKNRKIQYKVARIYWDT